jgi:hypothetical protein
MVLLQSDAQALPGPIWHLMRPLLRCLARPMKVEWKMRPYLGVLPLVFSALHNGSESLIE